MYNGLRYQLDFFESFKLKVLNIITICFCIIKNRPNSININCNWLFFWKIKITYFRENSSTATAKNEFIKDAATIKLILIH